ncbi:MAG: AAA family ATPase [Nanoarchaeota archaeon]|nr:AAA family ATPase [Nanoarchaeota archaeon]
MILGLTGSLCAGKGEVANYLKSLGFVYFSLSDVIRDELDKNSMLKTRENLISLGNKLRKEHGNGVLAEKIKEKLTSNENIVIDSIRNPEEIEELRKLPGFVMMGVDALEETRFARMLERKRPGDPKTIEGFREINEDMKIKHGQRVQSCMKLADCIIVNNVSIDKLHQKIDKLLTDVGYEKQGRLGIDEYFLKIASVVAERSTCKRHKIGAIAVKDRKILTTGYNGAGAGMKDCLELGCLRDDLGIESGTRHEICRAIHAEQNVIIQAALHRANLEGSTIYCTHSPCILCAKMLVNAKIKRLVTFADYADQEFLKLFDEAGIKFEKRGKPQDRIYFKE